MVQQVQPSPGQPIDPIKPLPTSPGVAKQLAVQPPEAATPSSLTVTIEYDPDGTGYVAFVHAPDDAPIGRARIALADFPAQQQQDIATLLASVMPFGLAAMGY
jgi:hypothetical protein